MNTGSLRVAVISALALSLILPASVAGGDETRKNLDATERATLQRYAIDTWASFVAMTDPATGLPSDNIAGNLDPATRSAYTSPTNIGMYIWATIGARELGIIGAAEARDRVMRTVASVSQLERHSESGQYYNWYDPSTLETIHIWPADGNTVYPFLSSVDNGWLASALLMVANGAVPEARRQAQALVTSMDFGFYYDPTIRQIRGGYWPSAPPGQDHVTSVSGTTCEPGAADGSSAGWTCHHYGAFNTEPRIASYIGIALGEIPPEHYFGPWRTFPDTCDWSWVETKPIGEWVTYTVGATSIDVFEGAYPYGDTLLVPTWGRSMFEALMVPLVVPEEDWGKASWRVTHPLFVEAQIEHGLEEAGYGYWGFSPSSDPEVLNGYREYGVDAIGLEPNGYTSDVERTLYDAGFEGCREATPGQTDPVYGQGVVTPHAAFLALDFAADATMANLAALEADFPGLYGPGGFKDAVNVSSGQIADRYLSLDQGMVMASIVNALRNERLQRYFSDGAVRRALKPLMAMETFNAGRVSP